MENEAVEELAKAIRAIGYYISNAMENNQRQAIQAAKEADPSYILTLTRMARRLSVTQKWLRQQADAGEVPCLIADGRYLFNPTAVIESLAKLASTRIKGETNGNY